MITTILVVSYIVFALAWALFNVGIASKRKQDNLKVVFFVNLITAPIGFFVLVCIWLFRKLYN